jgi:hypothetical protein
MRAIHSTVPVLIGLLVLDDDNNVPANTLQPIYTDFTSPSKN